MNKTLLALLLGVLLCGQAAAEPDIEGKSPEAAAQAIADYAEDYHGGWQSSIAKGRMILVDAQGKETVRPLDTYAIEAQKHSEGGRSQIVYDDDGTALITYMYRDQQDAQWVWVPGLRRKMRIQANNMSGAFIGSEFSYEDLRSQYPQKFDMKLLAEENHEGLRCWVIERIPTESVTNYSRQVVWMDQKHYRVLKTDFYDLQGRHLKTMTTHNWAKRDGFWRADMSQIVNHQTGRASYLNTDSVEVKAGINSFKKYLR